MVNKIIFGNILFKKYAKSAILPIIGNTTCYFTKGKAL